MSNKAVIYGVKTGDTYHYIGKTCKEVQVNDVMNNSDAKRQYHSDDIRQVFVNNSTEVVALKTCNENDWYDEKLTEVVDKYKDEHPLLNAQWMLDGKRGFWEGTQGYWQGKTRDANTLQKLSESKYKRVLEYDKQGNLIKVWKSGKAVATEVFGDYVVIKGAGETRLYDVLAARSLKGRLRHGSYWFWEAALVDYFGVVPNKLNIDAIRTEENKRRSARMKELRAARKDLGQRRYTVVRYNKDGSVKATYDNTHHCAYKLKISNKNVQRLCRGAIINNKYDLRYGEKVTQALNIKYPKFKAKEIRSTVPKISKAKPYIKTRTTYSVNQYVGGVVVETFNSVSDCADYFRLKPSTVRRICRGKMKLNYNDYPDLKLGDKITVEI